MRPFRAAWLHGWRTMGRYHRYEIEGFDNLPRDRAALIVGYHGRPLAHDQCMLTVAIHDRLGYLPHGVIHGSMQSPGLRRVVDELGFVCGDGPDVTAAIAAREHLLVQPGGTREGCRSFRHRYTVSWGRRRGYLRLAIRHGMPIVPVAASGTDDCFIGLNDGYAWGKRLGVPLRLPAWLGVGPLGVWPMSPPFPVKIRQLIGAPIETDVSVDDAEGVERLHNRVAGAVQSLLDQARRAA